MFYYAKQVTALLSLSQTLLKKHLVQKLVKKSNSSLLEILSSIRKAEPTFDFDKELEKAMSQYDELLKELVDK